MEHDIRTLDSVIAEESQALGFFTFVLGVFVSLVTTMVTSPPSGPVGKATVVALLVTSGLFSLWFGLKYRIASKKRPEILQLIRQEARELDKPQ